MTNADLFCRNADTASRPDKEAPITIIAAKSAIVSEGWTTRAGGHAGATSHKNNPPNRSEAKSVASAAQTSTIAHQDGGLSVCQCGGRTRPLPASSSAQSRREPMPEAHPSKEPTTSARTSSDAQ